jgi:hypothetical protein
MNTSSIVIDTINGVITATNLMIDTIGMYIIKVELSPTNNEYAFSLVSNAILVKKTSSKILF